MPPQRIGLPCLPGFDPHCEVLGSQPIGSKRLAFLSCHTVTFVSGSNPGFLLYRRRASLHSAGRFDRPNSVKWNKPL